MRREYTTFRTDEGGQRVTVEIVESPEEATTVISRNVPLTVGLMAGQAADGGEVEGGSGGEAAGAFCIAARMRQFGLMRGLLRCRNHGEML